MLWLLASLVIRSGIILGAGALVCGLLGRVRAAQRHAVLLLAFILLCVWPLLANWLPEIGLPLLTHSAGEGTVTVQQVLVSRGLTHAARGLVISPIWLWLAAVALALGPLMIAHYRVRRIVRRAVPCEDVEWNLLLGELAGESVPMLLIHPDRVMPMVVGMRQPKIVLPRDCAEWSPARRRIVLLHELAHISRKDLLTQLCARLITAVWWFQPLAWNTLRLLRNESERACDEFVIEAGVRPSDYAAELLEIAHSFAGQGGMAMARAEGLEGRLNLILRPQSVKSRSLPFVAFVCLAVLTFAASAVTLFPESEPISKRGSMTKHTLFAGLLATAGLSAATIGGSLYDPSGAAVPNAKALLYDPDTNSKFEAVSGADGKFSFDTLPAGQYILRVQSPGFATLFREFNVKADSKVDRGLTLALGKMQETVNVTATGTPAAAATNSSAPKPLRVGGAVEQANLVTKIQPVYPASAKEARLQGAVMLEMVVSKEGEPLDIRVISSPGDDLTRSAMEAVRQWRYKPVLLNGNPVEVVTDVLVNYTLSK